MKAHPNNAEGTRMGESLRIWEEGPTGGYGPGLDILKIPSRRPLKHPILQNSVDKVVTGGEQGCLVCLSVDQSVWGAQVRPATVQPAAC